MFAKADKGQAVMAEHVTALRGAVVGGDTSVIGMDLAVVGNVECEGDVQIFGSVEGNVRGRTVIVEYEGHVEGQIIGRHVHVCGSVNGAIAAADVSIEKSASVVGNITHSSLTVEPGAYLEGRRPWRPRPLKTE